MLDMEEQIESKNGLCLLFEETCLEVDNSLIKSGP